jgi:signal transduction histidine kinase
MTWQPTIYSLLAVAAAGIALLVAFQAWRHRSEPAACSFTALMLALGGWSFAYAVELGFTTSAEQLLWQAAGLAIGGLIPTLWFLFVLQYSGRDRGLTWGKQALLAAEPVLFAFLALTNPYHGLVWHGVTFTATPPRVVNLSFGMGYYLHVAYAYLVITAGLGLLVLVFGRASVLYRKQTGLLILGVLPPFAANIAFTLGWGPFFPLDLTPFAFAVTGILFGLALFRFDLLERTPVACQRALDEMGDGFVVLDIDGNVMETNAIARRALDLRSDGGQPVTDVGHDAAETPDATLEAIDGRTITTTAEGQQRAYDVTCSPLTDLREETAGYVIGLRDVTDRNEYQQRLEVAQRVLRHNLRNEMNVILGWAEHLEETATESQLTAVEQIIDTADELIDLSEDIRTMVTMDEQATDERTTLDVSETLVAILDEFRSDHPGVSIENEIPATVAIVLPDEMFLEIAVTNLVRNAVEHNDAQDPWVRVSVETTDDRVRIRIEDNGPEIPQMEREVLEEGTETPLYHGTGVGLWLTYWSVTAAGGRITFDSRTPRGNAITLEYLDGGRAPS